jgi:glycosyltransferase involved in cell wall biosynthesis
MKAALRAAAGDSQIIHSHSLWMMPNIYPVRCVKGTDCRLVVSPRGTLDPWAFNHRRGRKSVVWLLGQRANLDRASCIHATAEQEYGFIRDLGFTAPVAIIPNGAYIPDLSAVRELPADRRRLLFMARVHPKKGVDVLLEAWRNVQEAFPDWELQVAGPDDGGYLAVMRRLASELGARRVTFSGRLPDQDKAVAMKNAELYVLPTHNENWGVTIAEALAYGTPAIVGRGAPWSGLETYECGWWIENSVDALTACLRQSLALEPKDLRERGERGRAWMREEFGWSKVGQMTDRLYRWLVEGGESPSWVRTG